MTEAQRAALDPDSEEMRLRIHGSQTHLVGWIFYTSVLWTLKLCWLFFFKRVGDGVKRMAFKINIGFAFVLVTYTLCFFTLLCSCWPIHKRWQVNPDPGSESTPLKRVAPGSSRSLVRHGRRLTKLSFRRLLSGRRQTPVLGGRLD